MKQLLKISFFLLLVVSINFNVLAQQNMIFNYDFEFYSQCPDNSGQADRCFAFFSLVEDVDYSNCNFDITDNYPYYSLDSGAYSGTGFMTMATYGVPNGASESLAQNLQVALDSGVTYDLHVVIKKADSGQFNTDCGGLYLYGFEDTVIGPNWTLCVADLPGATLLGFTDSVSEITWTGKGFTFVAPFNIKAIAISPACAVNCYQVLFVDSITISLSLVDISLMEKEAINIYPLPASEKLVINFENDFSEKNIFIYNVSGKLIASSNSNSNPVFVNVGNFSDGLYFMKIVFENNLIHKKFIVQH